MIRQLFTLVFVVGSISAVNAADAPPALVLPPDEQNSGEQGLGAQTSDADENFGKFGKLNAVATANYCEVNGNKVAKTYLKEQLDVRGSVHAFFYNSAGDPCYVSRKARITEGDLFVVGYFGDTTGPLKFQASRTTCDLENPDGRITDQFISVSPKLENQSGQTENLLPQNRIGFRQIDAFDCYGSDAAFKVTRVSDKTDLDEKTLKQYPRYQATWQVGALWTDLQDRNYKLIDRGAGNVITSETDGSDGPIYVGSVTVYGFPRYVQTWFGKQRYSGRDIINHNRFLDRIGLNFSFGLENPTETLGVGLSYELVKGVSVTYSKLYRQIDVLDGVKVGDAFTAADIPTQESWEDESVWGIAIDGRLIAKFFGGGSK